MADVPLEIETESIKRPDGNMFGKMLNHIRSIKELEKSKVKQKMFARHNITPRNMKHYKLVEDRTITPHGTEFIELRLYQLIDGAVITIKPDVKAETEGGIKHLLEFKTDGEDTTA